MSVPSRSELERQLYENLAALAGEEASTEKLSSVELLREMVRFTGLMVENGVGGGGGGGSPAIAVDTPVFVISQPPDGYEGRYVRFVPNGDGTVDVQVEDGQGPL